MMKFLGALWVLGIGILWIVTLLGAQPLTVLGWSLFAGTIGQIIIASMWLYCAAMEPV